MVTFTLAAAILAAAATIFIYVTRHTRKRTTPPTTTTRHPPGVQALPDLAAHATLQHLLAVAQRRATSDRVSDAYAKRARHAWSAFTHFCSNALAETPTTTNTTFAQLAAYLTYRTTPQADDGDPPFAGQLPVAASTARSYLALLRLHITVNTPLEHLHHLPTTSPAFSKALNRLLDGAANRTVGRNATSMQPVAHTLSAAEALRLWRAASEHMSDHHAPNRRRALAAIMRLATGARGTTLRRADWYQFDFHTSPLGVLWHIGADPPLPAGTRLIERTTHRDKTGERANGKRRTFPILLGFAWSAPEGCMSPGAAISLARTFSPRQPFSAKGGARIGAQRMTADAKVAMAWANIEPNGRTLDARSLRKTVRSALYAAERAGDITTNDINNHMGWLLGRVARDANYLQLGGEELAPVPLALRDAYMAGTGAPLALDPWHPGDRADDNGQHRARSPARRRVQGMHEWADKRARDEAKSESLLEDIIQELDELEQAANFDQLAADDDGD